MSERVENLLSQLTLEEKISMLAGADMWRSVPVERLDIPSFQVTDGPNGARGTDDNVGETSSCFPVGIAMGATWNPELIQKVGASLAGEAKAKGAQVLLAPTVNIHRTPIAGRNFECFAEDPFLSGMIASAYINGLQSEGVAACIKHFVANDQEFERFSISSEVADRPLHEIYLEPFRIAMENANPWTIMSGYNRINGVHASENDVTLKTILKEKWGFDGVVISDWYGTYSDGVPAGGLDIEMPGPARWMAEEKVKAAMEAGDLDEAGLDDKVRRLLVLMERVNAFDPDANKVDPNTNTPANAALTRQTANEAIVLLKNEGNLLPLDLNKVNRIAVIGQNGGVEQILGGGSSAVNYHYAITPLQGIKTRVGAEATVGYEIGCPIYKSMPPLSTDWMVAPNGERGWHLNYFGNLELADEPTYEKILAKSELSWFGTMNPFVDPRNFSLRMTGTLVAPESRDYELHLTGIGQSRLFVNGEIKVDQWEKAVSGAWQETKVTLALQAGERADLVLEYVTDPDVNWRMVKLGCTPKMPADPLQAALDLAANSDVVVLVAGLNAEWESEGFDRPDMKLVKEQDALIAAVTAVNPNTIVALNVGSPVEMPWVDDVPAILQMWYAGQENGNALADVLFGDVDASGRLPISLPKRLEDNPAYLNYPGENGKVHYGEGLFVGYRYYDKKGIEPQFPFGHGLSYTNFAYSDLEVVVGNAGISATVTVKNVGDRAGMDVVQLYVHHEKSRLVRPNKELKAFAKIALAAGESKQVTLELSEQSLAFYDPAVGDWMAEAGMYEILVGRSAADIRLREVVTWVGENAGNLHTGMPIQVLMENPAAKVVLEKMIGHLLSHPQASSVGGMSLRQIAGMFPGALSDGVLAEIDVALAEIQA